jgi:hypothetical protein
MGDTISEIEAVLGDINTFLPLLTTFVPQSAEFTPILAEVEQLLLSHDSAIRSAAVQAGTVLTSTPPKAKVVT